MFAKNLNNLLSFALVRRLHGGISNGFDQLVPQRSYTRHAASIPILDHLFPDYLHNNDAIYPSPLVILC